jgi:hypothetical protein
VLVAEAFASECLGATPGNSVVVSRMEDADLASTGEPFSGF